MKPSLVSEALNNCLTVKQPVFVWGPPGAGKSSIVKQLAKATNKPLIDLRLTLLDSLDLRGFPRVKDDLMHFAEPVFLPREGHGILFLDEMNAARESVQAAAYQLVLDRKLGEYTLPDGWDIIAAGNRETDQGVVYTMPSPLANRFVHIDFDVDFDDWRRWAIDAEFKTELTNFIAFRPNLLMEFDPDRRAFPTPRSWEFVNKILHAGSSTVVERSLIAGAVGDGAAAEFAAFLKIFRTLPNPDAILMNPSKAEMPDDPATLYALCGALAERANEANFERLIEFADRMRGEFQVLCVRDSVARNKDLAHTKAFTDWAIKNANVLI